MHACAGGQVGDQYPQVRERLRKRLARLNRANFDPYRGDEATADKVACAVLNETGGVIGPWTGVEDWVWTPEAAAAAPSGRRPSR